MGTSTATVVWTMTDDPGSVVQTVSQSVSLSGQKGTQFWVGRAGERGVVTITGSPSQTGRILDIRAEIEQFGKAGRVAV